MKNNLCLFGSLVRLWVVRPLVMFCVCASYSQILADNGGDLVFQAYKNRGDNPSVIKTCFVEFLLVSTQPMPDAQYQEEASRRRDTLLKAMEGHKEPEQLLASLEKAIREKQLTPQRMKGTYLYRFSTDQQRQTLFSIFYQNENQDTPTTVISEVGPQRVVCASLDVKSRSVQILRKPGYITDFYLMGRIKGEPISNLLYEAEKTGIGVADILKKSDYQSVGTETYDDNAQMFLLERRKDGHLIERYGIDPSKGHICPVIQVFDEKTGHPTEEYISGNFFLHPGSGLWFPASYIATRYNTLTGELVSKQEYTIVPDTIKINQPVSEHEFSIDVPAGFNVDNTRTDTFIRYRAYDAGTISLSHKGLDLDNMKWLSRVDLPGDTYEPPTGGASGWTRWSLIGIGIVLILIALGRMIFRQM